MPILWLIFGSGLLLAGIAEAASIEVIARYRDGRPVTGEKILLIPHSAFRNATYPSVPRPPSKTVTTDRDGRAVFSELAPGTYGFSVFGTPSDPLLVKPEHNPVAPSPMVRLDEKDDRRQLDLELWQGVPVRVEAMHPDGRPAVGWRVRFRHLATGYEISRDAFAKPAIEWAVAPALWEASLAPQPGFVALVAEHDGERQESVEVRLDLETRPWKADLRWILESSPGSAHPTFGRSGTPPGAETPLTIKVLTERFPPFGGRVEIHALHDRGVIIDSGVDPGGEGLGIAELPAGDYLVVASHPRFLEGRAELRGWDPSAAPRILEVPLPVGAAIRLQALDIDDRPVFGLELTIERLGDAAEILGSDADFHEAKRRRVARTGKSGWVESRGFYPGRYRLRGILPGVRGSTHEIYLGLPGGELLPEIEITLEDQPIEIEARVLAKD